ncbi:XrtB/PEP-CTERM-associated polysaccharide biosynthesis outer membrane protein EpsL [Sulfuriferula thiophila]|uniref:XrtB/PEP-CTERM-associated polysaccharide biosynthesis outer membrane protein EpsL n=1 Tax=Sulfuriferula thiophila TaxID=1781211 RepID=UPI000F60CFD2|nr:XrtB/PEP-CTERM-associated polysaccharide biosynthesis outer membrane protein EpsL [Sulfuriferula thiophila]
MMKKAPLFALCVSSFSSLAHANISDTFSPYVSAAYNYNSNLFLLQNEQAALATLGTTTMSESYKAYAAGVGMNWKTGRQVISGHAEASQINFDTYKTMDYTGHDLALKWDWLIGDTLLGDVGASETLTLAPFLYTKKPLANLLNTRKAFFNGNIKLNNRWQLKLGAEKTQKTNSDATQQYNDINIDTYKTGFRYLTPKGSKIDFNSSVSTGTYPNRPLNAYNQYDNGIGFDWIATGKTRVQGKVNYTRRNYPDSQQLNYSGITGRISADWFITGKTTLNLALYRDINSFITDTSSYDVTQGISAKATWLATANVAVNLNAKHDSIDYLNTPHRKDELSTLNLDVAYTLLRNTKLDVVAERGVRSSNIDGNSYRYNSLTIGLNHAF